MLLNICLFACTFTLGQAANQNLWQLSPRFERGQELVYSGSFVEESLATGVEFQRRWRLETRLVVLDAAPKSWDVAVLTALQRHREPDSSGAAKEKTHSASVRLEVIKVDAQGRVKTEQGRRLPVIVDGPPTVEIGALVTMPTGRIGEDHRWVVMEPDRPPLNWRVVGTEIVSSTRCIKLEGTQQSDDWQTPRADSTAWKRLEHVWLAPQTGIVYRVQRVIEQRDPARTKTARRLRVSYDLDRNWIYPRKLFESYQRELSQVARFSGEADRYVRQPDQHRTQLANVRQRISSYLQRQQNSLQRDALEQIKHRVEAAQRGEIVAAPSAEPAALIPQAKLGQRAPDFLVSDLTSKRSVRLHSHLGRPVLIVFYNPKTSTGLRVLRFAKELHDKHRADVTILAMAVTDDVAAVKKQHQEMRLPFAVLDGKGLHRTFGVDATPRAILLDAEGMVRLGRTGWGYHVADEITREVQRCLAKQEHP